MMRILPALWTVALAIWPAIAFGQSVQSVFPGQHALDVPAATFFSATFDVEMNGATINATTFKAYSSGSAPLSGAIGYDYPTRTATFEPDNPLTAGDVVTVILTEEIHSAVGDPLTGGYLWSFTVAADAGPGFISPYRTLPGAPYPRAICPADINGDGHLDIVTANNGTDSISVFQGNGDGTFGPRVDYIVHEAPWSVAAGDLDGDGDVDVVTADYLSSDVSVLLNDATGQFAVEATYPVGERPEQICLADFNNDGAPDLATADSYDNTVSILMNNGDGTFSIQTLTGVGSNPYLVIPFDLDNDGDLDLAVTNGAGQVVLFHGLGEGIFIQWTSYPVGLLPYSGVAADLNGDGHLDLAVANIFDHNISVMLNQGNGTLAPDVLYATEYNPSSLVAADVDGDGDLDLAASNSNSAAISVLANNGDGTFAAGITYPVWYQPWASVAADIDHDGDLDLLTAHYSPSGVISILYSGCNCLGYGDVNAAGGINPVDVSYMVNHVYLQRDAREQLVGCPGDNGDWNCDGQLTPLDVAFYVNYVFKGWGTGPCNPCECAPYPTGCP